MGRSIQISRPDGGSCSAYLSAEQTPPDAPGIVVIQEWWGLNEQIKNVADRFAEKGYRAIVPDLFGGKLATSADEASHMMANLNFQDAADQDIQGSVNYLLGDSKRCGVAGFCMGGALTILSALRVSGVDAGACFYGIPPKAAANPSDIAIPMIFHFAQLDDWCTPQLVDDLDASLKVSKSRFELYRYSAQHGFMNETRPAAYNAECAALAWQRTTAFFERNLKAQ